MLRKSIVYLCSLLLVSSFFISLNAEKTKKGSFSSNLGVVTIIDVYKSNANLMLQLSLVKNLISRR